MKTIKVKDLVAALKDMPQDAPVLVWMPGAYIALSTPFVGQGKNAGKILIEGNNVL